MDTIRQQVQEWWRSLARWQRFAAVGLGVTGLALLIYLTALSQVPEYAVVYSDLTEQDAAAIVDALKKEGTPYKLADGGRTILVPARQVYEVRLSLAQQGLPREGTVGFEIFDAGAMGNLGMTDFVQKVNYQRALEGELSRTIASLDPLQSARVHLVIPEPKLFLEEAEEPSASVLVQLKPGRRLAQGQIQAITNLVASSVEGLTPERVTIVDAEGNVLWSGFEDARGPDPQALSAARIELQREYEKALEKRLQNLLDRTLGPRRAAVQVSVALDWDRLETNSETYTSGPNGGVVRSSRVIEEYQGEPGSTPGGVPGVDSNAPGVPFYSTVVTDTEQAYVRRETIYNYEVSKTIQTLIKEPGNVKRLSVAVALDEEIPAEQVQRIEQMVAAAVGLDPSRGDTIAVTTVPFDQSFYEQQQEALRAAQRQALIIAIAKVVGSLVGLILLLLFVRRLFLDLAYRRLYPRMAVIPAGEQLPVQVPALESGERQLPPGQGQAVTALQASQAYAAAEEQEATRPSDEEVEEHMERQALPEPEGEDLRYLKQMQRMAQEDPEAVARLIETWLRED